MTEEVEATLRALAMVKHPLCTNWYGIKGGGRAKSVKCYICDATIDTYAAQWRRPKHVDLAIEEHLHYHADALAQ